MQHRALTCIWFQPYRPSPFRFSYASGYRFCLPSGFFAVAFLDQKSEPRWLFLLRYESGDHESEPRRITFSPSWRRFNESAPTWYTLAKYNQRSQKVCQLGYISGRMQGCKVYKTLHPYNLESESRQFQWFPTFSVSTPTFFFAMLTVRSEIPSSVARRNTSSAGTGFTSIFLSSSSISDVLV